MAMVMKMMKGIIANNSVTRRSSITPAMMVMLSHTRGYRSDFDTWANLHRRSVNPSTREQFWDEQAKKLEWFTNYESVLSFKDPKDLSSSVWFKGGQTNLCHNAIDRHVNNGRGSDVALIYDSPVTGVKTTYSYSDLQREVSKCAFVLSNLGVSKGDRVIIYMPMIPEAVISMLAVVRLGAIHSVVFGGFASRELAVRIDDAKPKCIISASCGVEPGKVVDYAPLLHHALELAKHKPSKVLFKRRSGKATDSGKDLYRVEDLTTVVPEHLLKNGTTTIHDFDEEMKKPTTKSFFPPVPVAGDDISYVLYTSGTTGTPKGIVRDTGGYQTALRFCMEYMMQLGEGDTYFCTSDIGWVVGHSFIVYGPLLAGLRTVLYEGKPVGTPDATAYWRVASEYGANAIYTAPTAMRAIRKFDPELALSKKFDLSKLRTLFCAGERGDPETVKFFSTALKIPVVDNFWQTETGWPVISWHDEKIGIKHGSASRPMPGYDVKILDVENSKELPADQMGELCIKLPLPPGTLTTVFNNPQRFKSAYMAAHPGYYSTGDYAIQDRDHYVSVMSRKDDLINVAGHRLATTTIEQAISMHPAVAECACIGAADSLKGEIPVAFVVLKADAKLSHKDAEKEIVALVRDEVGPVASFRTAFVVDLLPKTRSGKILRGIMKSMADKKEFNVPATIEDQKVLDNIHEVIKARWFPIKS